MLNKILLMTTVAALTVLLAPSKVDAWGAAHAGVTRVGPGGVYHAGRTVTAGPGGVHSTGRVGAVGPYGGGYRAGYTGGVGYGGAYGGGYRYATPAYVAPGAVGGVRYGYIR